MLQNVFLSRANFQYKQWKFTSRKIYDSVSLSDKNIRRYKKQVLTNIHVTLSAYLFDFTLQKRQAMRVCKTLIEQYKSIFDTVSVIYMYMYR